MGFLDIFRKQDKQEASGAKSDRDLGRLEKLISNKLSQNLDRLDALERLARMGTPEAAGVLLKRFSWTLDPSITDQEEKDIAVRGIAAAGEGALPVLHKYCARAESITWPLKAVRQIVSGDALVQELLTILDQFDTDYVRNPEPKLQLIQILADHPSDDVRIAVEPFLTDVNEGIRFAAATAVFAVGNPASVPSFIAALRDEESLRVKNRIASGLAEREWTIPAELHASCTEVLPAGYTLAGDRVRAGR